MAQQQARQPAAQQWNFDGIPDASQGTSASTTSTAPATGQWNLDGIPDAAPKANLVNNDFSSQLGRTLYSSLPAVGASLGGALGFMLASPTAVVSGPVGPATGGLVGAGAGAMVGRGAQWLLDRILDRPAHEQNPLGAGQEATQQMMVEAGGGAFGRVVGGLRGNGLPGRLTEDAATRTNAVQSRQTLNQQHNLRLSYGEITESPGALNLQTTLGARGFAGRMVQANAQAQTRANATRAVEGILSRVGPPSTSLTAGTMAQEAIGDNVARTGRRVEGAISQLAPKTSTTATGDLAERGVQAGRRAFAVQGQQLQQIVAEGPDIDIRPLKDEALRVLREEVMPYLEKVPAEAPKDAAFKKLMELYRAGKLIDLGAESKKALEDAALDKSNHGPLKVINTILTAADLLPFKNAAALNTSLREAGKGTDLIAADRASALSSYFMGGSKDTATAFRGLRGLMAEAHPTWDAAAAAYGPNAQLFESRFLQGIVDKDPEAVLAAVTGRAGAENATNVQRLYQTLVALPQQFGGDVEQAAGRRAWDTLRAEWLRREVVQDDLFGVTKRIRSTDPDVLRAWFPDVPGKDVLKRAIAAGRQFQSQLLAEIAQADPSAVVPLIGRTPSRVKEAESLLTQAPYDPAIWQRIKRSWIEQTLTGGDPGDLLTRIDRTDPDLLKAWLSSPEEQQGLQTLRQIGAALAIQPNIPARGTFEGVEAVTVVSSLLSGNFNRALVLAVGFEGVPFALSQAMYSPRLQKYLLDASNRSAPVSTRTAALIRAGMTVRAAQQQEQQAQMQQMQTTPAIGQ